MITDIDIPCGMVILDFVDCIFSNQNEVDDVSSFIVRGSPCMFSSMLEMTANDVELIFLAKVYQSKSPMIVTMGSIVELSNHVRK